MNFVGISISAKKYRWILIESAMNLGSIDILMILILPMYELGCLHLFISTLISVEDAKNICSHGTVIKYLFDNQIFGDYFFKI